MTTDRLCSVEFSAIPIGDTFEWNRRSYAKVSLTHAKNSHGIEVEFPQNFQVDIAYSHAWRLGIEIEDVDKPEDMPL